MSSTRTLAPPLSRLAMEELAVLEYGTLLAASPLLGLIRPGDGHAVLVLPGFGASDRSTAPLRGVLRSFGHDPHGWRLGTNVGPYPQVLAGMERRLTELCQRSGRPVSLVGWSLGGVYAREMARQRPDSVRQVITLASPFRFRAGDRTHASALYDYLAPPRHPFPHHIPEHRRPDLPVPSTAVYTRTDGIVRWHLCVEADGPRRENIEVRGTHTGLGSNIAAVVAVADRLAQPDGRWRRFRPPSVMRHLYPTPVYWSEDKRRVRV